MATNIGDLVNDVVSTGGKVKGWQASLKIAEERLINALALAGTPLKVGGSVVIGTTLIKMPYSSLPLEFSDIANVDPSQVVE